MTAEIAILNKSAVALASDSAVTIGEGADAKIYKTVNKIFELSDTHPVGLMIYGSMEFMGLPLETIAKLFRRDVGNNINFETVEMWLEEFLNYLEKNVPYTIEDESDNIAFILRSLFNETNKKVEKAIFAEVRKDGKYLISRFNKTAQKIIKKEIEKLKVKECAPCFTPGQKDKILTRYDVLTSALITKIFTAVGPTKATTNLLKRLARLKLHRATLSDHRTGIVLAGFGTKEICPSLCSAEIDGIINSKLKVLPRKAIDIGRRESGADVVAFAQDEMVTRFLQGVDPGYDKYVSDRMKTALNRISRIIFKAEGHNPQKVQSKVSAIKSQIEAISKDFVVEGEKHKERTYKNDVLSMVRFMPKQELVTFADSLIHLTSLKRKVSAEQETVAGPIDVAMISKSEGFVWIKRKHYFPKELNARFYNRHYRA